MQHSSLQIYMKFVKISVETHNKKVVVIGLDGDSDVENFGQIHKLIPLCDDIIKLKALCSQCKDGTPGIFSKNNKFYIKNRCRFKW